MIRVHAQKSCLCDVKQEANCLQANRGLQKSEVKLVSTYTSNYLQERPANQTIFFGRTFL